jgi:hypothetical protein
LEINIKKEMYEKPEIRSENFEMTVYGQAYGEAPLAALQPFFGLCPPCENGV